jgi:death on curing protein
MSEPVFLTPAQVEILHRLALEQHGGRDGVRDPDGLQSAILLPHHVHSYGQGDLFDIAAAYAFHLAQSQAFLDGNKRTGMAAALVFLRVNGITVPQATDELHAAMIAIAERRMDKPELAALLRRMAVRS